VAKIISALPFLVGFIIAGFTKRKQALHDFIASTVVVRAAQGHVVAALALALVALVAPVLVVMMFGAGMVAEMMGGFAGTMLSEPQPQVVMQAPKPAAAPALKPAAPAPAAAPAPKPAAPAPAAAPAAPKPEAKPAAAPAAAPMVLAQAAAAPPKPTPAEPPKQVEQPKPAPQEAAPPAPVVQEAPKPKPEPRAEPVPQPERRLPSTPGPQFNDLVTAILYKNPRGVEELLAFGKWPDKRDSRGVTPLMLAAQLSDAMSAEALLKAGANPNLPGPDTATSIARERNDAAMLGLMQRYGGR
jgi:hypothetical protein